jgi:hypothetical protein
VSTLSDALGALKNVVLMQERLDVMGRKLDRLSVDVQGLNDYALSIDKRVIRIETMIEMSGRSPTQPRIEG